MKRKWRLHTRWENEKVRLNPDFHLNNVIKENKIMTNPKKSLRIKKSGNSKRTSHHLHKFSSKTVTTSPISANGVKNGNRRQINITNTNQLSWAINKGNVYLDDRYTYGWSNFDHQNMKGKKKLEQTGAIAPQTLPSVGDANGCGFIISVQFWRRPWLYKTKRETT